VSFAECITSIAHPSEVGWLHKQTTTLKGKVCFCRGCVHVQEHVREENGTKQVKTERPYSLPLKSQLHQQGRQNTHIFFSSTGWEEQERASAATLHIPILQHPGA